MRVTMHKGFFYLHEAPSPEADNDFARKLRSEVSSSANYHHGHKRWRLPVSHQAVKALETMNLPLPPAIVGWRKQQDKLVQARARANAVKTMSPKEVKDRLDRMGVIWKVKPYDHQAVSVAYGLLLPAAAEYLDTGCGKTGVAAVVMDTLRRLKSYQRFLVMAPKSILNTSWGADITKFSDLKWVNISDPPEREPVTTCPKCGKSFKGHVAKGHLRTHMKQLFAREKEIAKNEVEAGVLAAAVAEETVEARVWDRAFAKFPELAPPGSDDKRTRLLRALKGDAQVFLINPESFKLVVDDLTDQDWDMCVVDESSCLKNPEAEITQKTIAFGASVRRRMCMTATPRPNSSLDFWGQMAFLDMSLGGSFYEFRRQFYYKGYDGYSWVAKTDTTDDEIRDIVFDRAIRYRLDDCVDLPGESYEKAEVTLTGKLRQHYDDMVDRMEVQLADGETITTSWAIVQANKLAQITSGFIFDDDGNARFLEDSPKISTTVEMAKRLIESEDRSVVIWVRFSDSEGRMLEDALSKYGVSTMHGGTKNHEASANAFISKKNRVMIANAASAKFGHTWVQSNVAIFHSYDYSFENFYQAKRRIYRIGQTKPVTYITVVAENTIDEVIAEAVKAKQEDSEAVVDQNVVSALTKAFRHGKR